MTAPSPVDMCHSTQLLLLTEKRHPPQGYCQRKQFIVAQSPMHSTTGDFWALIYEKQSPTILLLCPLQENEKVCVRSCVQMHVWGMYVRRPVVGVNHSSGIVLYCVYTAFSCHTLPHPLPPTHVCVHVRVCVVLFVYTDPYQHGVCDPSPHATLPQGIECSLLAS